MKEGTLKNLGPIIGHRGVAALAPENTLESFALAHQYGLQSVEFDVILSADGEAFVFHDEYLERTTNGSGAIGLASAEYLKTLDAGSWFSEEYKNVRIPTFREALIWLRKHNMSANIEIKPFPGCIHQTVDTVLQELDEIWPSSEPLPLISSFERDALHLCRKSYPKLPLGYLLDKWSTEEIEVAQTLDCCSINLNHLIVKPQRVKDLKEKGLAVYVYTVNRQHLVSRYFAYGVDGIFSDYPNWRITTS